MMDAALLHDVPRLGDRLGITLAVQRDDLLPFPLAGSKVRALTAEIAALPPGTDSVITNGSIDSNHCRTLAFMAASAGLEVDLVLHGDTGDASSQRALSLYRALGARCHAVAPQEIRGAIAHIEDDRRRSGGTPRIIPGGCHTPAAAVAYRDAALAVFESWRPQVVFVASGTGSIHGGLAAAASMADDDIRVIGVSVARDHRRGVGAVREAAGWAGATDPAIHFDDGFRDGGYGTWTEATAQAVSLAWSYGLPVDPTYTGKAFRALLTYARTDDTLAGARVLFWHTGGLWNYIQQAEDLHA